METVAYFLIFHHVYGTCILDAFIKYSTLKIVFYCICVKIIWKHTFFSFFNMQNLIVCCLFLSLSCKTS